MNEQSQNIVGKWYRIATEIPNISDDMEFLEFRCDGLYTLSRKLGDGTVLRSPWRRYRVIEGMLEDSRKDGSMVRRVEMAIEGDILRIKGTHGWVSTFSRLH